MAILYVTEFASLRGAGYPNALPIPANAAQAIATSATSAQSAAFQNNTVLLRINNDSSSAVSLAFGTNPTAVISTGIRMGANTTEYFDISAQQGDGWKVAAVVTTL